jgi:hypothetical protein
MPKDLTLKNTRLFAEEVMPHIQDLWSDYEDPWWPERVQRASTAAIPAPVGD